MALTNAQKNREFAGKSVISPHSQFVTTKCALNVCVAFYSIKSEFVILRWKVKWWVS